MGTRRELTEEAARLMARADVLDRAMEEAEKNGNADTAKELR